MTLTLTTRTDDLPPVGGHDVAAHIRCDFCGEPFQPADEASAVWEPDQRRRYFDVAFLHDGCRDGYADRRDADLNEMELGAFLRTLIHNLEEAG